MNSENLSTQELKQQTAELKKKIIARRQALVLIVKDYEDGLVSLKHETVTEIRDFIRRTEKYV